MCTRLAKHANWRATRACARVEQKQRNKFLLHTLDAKRDGTREGGGRVSQRNIFRDRQLRRPTIRMESPCRHGRLCWSPTGR